MYVKDLRLNENGFLKKIGIHILIVSGKTEGQYPRGDVPLKQLGLILSCSWCVDSQLVPWGQ